MQSYDGSRKWTRGGREERGGNSVIRSSLKRRGLNDWKKRRKGFGERSVGSGENEAKGDRGTGFDHYGFEGTIWGGSIMSPGRTEVK